MRNRAITAAAAALALLSAASCTDGPTQSVAADSIRVAWRTPLNTGTGGTPGLQGIAADAERLYVITRGVAAYDLRTGEQRWHTPNAPAAELGNGRAPVNVVTRDGRVFTSGHVARALVAATGAELWTFTPDTAAVAMTTVDERAFYIGTESRRVYSLDVATGKPRWSAEVLPRGPYRAVVTGIVLHGDTLYVSLVEETSRTGHLKRGWIVAVERHEGRVLWRYVNERQGEAHDAGRHAVAGPIVLVNDLNGGAFLGIDRFTGKEVWRHVGPAGLFGAWDEFKVADGIAYVASNDTRVYAFDPETGRNHWTHRLKGSANSSAVCGEHIFAAAGSLHMLSRADGKQKSVLFQDREGFVQPDAFVVSRLLATGNRVYFVGHNAVYAVECSP